MVSGISRVTAAATVLISAAVQPVWAQDATSTVGTANQPTVLRGSVEVDDIANQIAQKELDLMKLNTNLKIEQLPDRWAGRRWFFDNEALIGCVATGSYMNGTQRLRFQRKPTKISKYFFGNAGWTRMIGSWIIVGGAAIEISALAARQYHQFRTGVDPETMRKYADGLQNSIDDLLHKREAAIAASGVAGPEKQALDSETLVLRDVRNLSVNEFARYYAGAKGNAVGQYAGYLIAGANNGLIASGAITGNHYGLEKTKHGTARERTRGGGAAGVCDTIAGAVNMSVPFTTRAIAYAARHSARQSVARQLDCAEPAHLDQLHEHQKEFHALVASQPDLAVHGFVGRDSIFAKQASIFDQHEALRIGEAKAARTKFLHQFIFFESVGATKVANGIGSMVGGFKYTNNAHLRFQALGGVGIAQGVGYTVAGSDLLASQLWGEIQSARLRSQHRATGQILHKQVEELTALGGKG
jgi:hypothetical protein